MIGLPAWIAALVVILILQTTSAYLIRLIPVVAPALVDEFGWDGGWIGYLSAANTLGALFILFAGTGMLRRIGAVGALQATLVLGAASLAIYHFPSVGLALLASFLIGLSYGVTTPAGSEVLQRFTPQAHRNFVFSIKQAGIPLGGVIAGLGIPPLVEAYGWRTALAVAGAGVIVATVVTVPFRSRIDGPRARSPFFVGKLSLADLAAPLSALARSPGVMRISIVGALLLVAQSCWFTFTAVYLVVGLGLSLSMAGAVFAVMQASGAVARIVVGWITDRYQCATATLMVASVASAATTVLLGLTSRDWPVWSLVLLAAAAGASVSGWNGVQVAEVARRAPPERVAETAAGSVILVYLSLMMAPAAFGVFVAATGRFDYAFVVAGLCSLLCLPLLRGLDRAKG